MFFVRSKTTGISECDEYGRIKTKNYIEKHRYVCSVSTYFVLTSLQVYIRGNMTYLRII